MTTPHFPADRDEYVRLHGNENAATLVRKKLCALGQGHFPSARVRRWLARRMGVAVGDGAWLGKGVYLDDVFPELIRIGEGAVLGLRCLVICHDDALRRVAPVRIGAGAFIGAAAILLPGVEIGDGARVGAGSVVTRSVPAGETWAGVPARRLDRPTSVPVTHEHEPVTASCP